MAQTNIRELGYRVETGDHVLARDGFTAGTLKDRLDDLHNAFRSKSIDAVWAIRGGYGCTQLLPHIDYDLLRANPKPIIGYSDLTALINTFPERAGTPGWHAPVASSEWTELATASFNAVATGRLPYSLSGLPYGATITPGAVEGPLVGGNLTVLAAMCGTPYQVDLSDKLVFLEDVGEAPYRIDRMLVQLIQAAGLANARGIALGDFVDCEATSGSPTLQESLTQRLGGLGIPVYHGLPFGHGELNATLPIGGSARLDAGAGRLVVG